MSDKAKVAIPNSPTVGTPIANGFIAAPATDLYQRPSWDGLSVLSSLVRRINEQITSPEVRVIGAEGELFGVLTLEDALRFARAKNLDLVEVNPTTVPPMCQIMDAKLAV